MAFLLLFPLNTIVEILFMRHNEPFVVVVAFVSSHFVKTARGVLNKAAAL